MLTFIIGIFILITGGVLYGRLCERVIKPTDNATPATTMRDDVDFVPMKKWKNSLIELLNIAGTGPILGPIQGILFGPIAFITIPIGCVLGGAFHDYMVGMISVRNNGDQTPGLVRRFLGNYIYHIYQIFVCMLMLLVAVVFTYMPGDLFVSSVLNQDAHLSNPVIWVVYGVIFGYYILATLFPIDKIIGKIYPFFGAILLISAVGVFVGLFIHGYPLCEIWQAAPAVFPYEKHFLPLFFVTVTCGICSGFHSTQATIVSRTIENEHEGRTTFYDMMIAEGFIAMTWAAAAMGAVRLGLVNYQDLSQAPVSVVGVVSKNMLGHIGGLIAIIGVIVLPITSGDTALRSLRMMVGDALHIDQTKKRHSLAIALCIFALVSLLLMWAKHDPEGFNVIWRYFSWANETTVVFVLTMVAVYMKRNNMPYMMAIIPAAFYLFIISGYILHAQIGFHLPWNISTIFAVTFSVIYVIIVILRTKTNIFSKKEKRKK